MVKLPFRIGSPKIYKLRARKKEGNRVHWEDIEEYDEYVRLPDIRETIDTLSEDGYDAFMLLECNDKGTDCRKRWVKYVRRKTRNGELLSKSRLISELKELKELYNTLSQVFEGNRASIDDLVANLIAYEELKKELVTRLKAYGLVSGEGGKSELQEIQEFISILKELGAIQQSPQQQQQQQRTLTQPKTQTETETESIPEPQELTNAKVKTPPIEEFERLKESTLKELKNKMTKEAMNAFIMCKKLGICEEGKEVAPA